MLSFEFLPTLPSLLAQSKIPLIHRDLSWLQFNERVLDEARNSANPLLERVKFLAISASNLDEFFMIRLASLGRSISAATRTDASGAEKLLRIRGNILESVAKFGARQSETLDLLASELEPEGIFLSRPGLSKEGEASFFIGRKLFLEQVFPKLAPPEAWSAAQLGNLENLQFGLLYPKGQWIRIPRALPSVLGATGLTEVEGLSSIDENSAHFFFLDDLLFTHLGAALRLEGQPALFRLTRDGDFTIDLEEEDTESIPDVVRSGLRTRDKGRPVRLQYSGEMNEEQLVLASRGLKLDSGQVIPVPQTICMNGLWTLASTKLKSQAPLTLRHPPLDSSIPKRLRHSGDTAGIFEKLGEQDLLLHHPYDSFDAYVQWIQAACADPHVESIEQTVYRMDTISPVIDALKSAAPNKKVRVIIELRARFDELNNLMLADELRKAGVEVGFGFGQLKLHAKLALVTRRENGASRQYAHLSTGNYNAATSRQYTDLAILTAHPEIGADVRHFFDSVWEEEIPTSFKQLVSAPSKLHKLLLNHILAETEAAKQGRKARIVAKVNALVDETVVEHLYKASAAGVQVDLIVRGACSLIPGVKGLSENIRVISVVDRFLEHSRIYYFGDSKGLYLSSADWMPRNFFSRHEIAFPVLDPHVHDYLENVVIPAYLFDTVKARELTPQGTWRKRTQASLKSFGNSKSAEGIQSTAGLRAAGWNSKPLRSQFFFEELAKRGYTGTPLE
jgi:polyphosphate kinase